MPIQKTTGYADSAGNLHATVELAQVAELKTLLATIDGSGMIEEVNRDRVIVTMAYDLVAHRDELLAILTTGPRSKPKARKAPGTTNPKRAARAKAATPEQAQAGFEAMREAAA